MHDLGTDAFLVAGTATGVAYTFDAPVPLPPAALLLGSAMAAFVALRRRRADGRVAH